MQVEVVLKANGEQGFNKAMNKLHDFYRNLENDIDMKSVESENSTGTFYNQYFIHINKV